MPEAKLCRTFQLRFYVETAAPFSFGPFAMSSSSPRSLTSQRLIGFTLHRMNILGPPKQVNVVEQGGVIIGIQGYLLSI